MSFDYSVDGKEYSIESIDNDNNNINIKVSTTDENKSPSSNDRGSRCFRYLIQFVSCVLIIAGVTEG